METEMKTRNLALLSAIMAAAVGAAAPSHAEAIIVNFGVVSLGASPKYTPGGDVANALTLNLGGGTDIVNTVGIGNAFGPGVGHEVSLTQVWNLAGGVGSDPDITKSWTLAAGTYTETLDDIVAIGRANTNNLSVTLSGDLTGPGIVGSSPVTLSFSATQTPLQEALGTYNWSITNLTTTTLTTPGPVPGVGLFGLASLLAFLLAAKAHASRA